MVAPHHAGGPFEPPISSNGQEEMPGEERERSNHAVTPPRVHSQPPATGGAGHQALQAIRSLPAQIKAIAKASK